MKLVAFPSDLFDFGVPTGIIGSRFNKFIIRSIKIFHKIAAVIARMHNGGNPFSSWKIYFSFASAALIASKFGKSFGVAVCSLYCTTPFLSMTNAARADVSPTPASIGNTTS